MCRSAGGTLACRPNPEKKTGGEMSALDRSAATGNCLACSLYHTPHSSLLLTHYSLFHSLLFPAHSTTHLTAHCSLLTAHCCIFHCSLLPAHCSLLLPRCFLTAHCSIVHCSLLPATCSLLNVHCALLSATAHYSLLNVYCSLGSLLTIHSLPPLTTPYFLLTAH